MRIGAPVGSYHVVLRHRNHLGVMTANPVQLGVVATTIDLRTSTTTTWGTQAQRAVGETRRMWSGEVVRDGLVVYTGANNDRDRILQVIGGTVPTNVVEGYTPSDVNMDGLVKYTGGHNDRDPILANIGGTVPTSSRLEQLP